MLFGNTPEKRIAREADKVASLKEDLDALSWGRVLDIGRELQSKGAEGAELGAELVSIAQSNLSLATRLGIDPAPPENRVMASGVEIVEGGLAEAALAVGETADADADTSTRKSPSRSLCSGFDHRASDCRAVVGACRRGAGGARGGRGG